MACVPLNQPSDSSLGALLNSATQAAGAYKICQDKQACLAAWSKQN